MQAAADGNGHYTLNGLQFAGFTVSAQAPGYVEGSKGGVLTSTTSTANFALLPVAFWSRSGQGNTVFDMPTYLTKVQVTGRLRPGAEFSSNFVIRVNGRLLVNEILGSIWGLVPTYSGIYATNGGSVEV